MHIGRSLCVKRIHFIRYLISFIRTGCYNKPIFIAFCSVRMRCFLLYWSMWNVFVIFHQGSIHIPTAKLQRNFSLFENSISSKRSNGPLNSGDNTFVFLTTFLILWSERKITAWDVVSFHKKKISTNSNGMNSKNAKKNSTSAKKSTRNCWIDGCLGWD